MLQSSAVAGLGAEPNVADSLPSAPSSLPQSLPKQDWHFSARLT